MKTEIAPEKEAEAKLREALKRVTFISQGVAETGQLCRESVLGAPDFVLPVRIGKENWKLACQIKREAQPRHTRLAVLELNSYLASLANPKVYPVLMAPSISPESAAICTEAGVGYSDFVGNYRLVFGNVFIESRGASSPKTKRRELRSLFSPKAARILRCMLRDPGRGWRVKDLNDAAGVSIGQVSNVRRALLDREWARVGPEGLVLTQARALLDAWRDVYKDRSLGKELYYTLMHGSALDHEIKSVLDSSGQGAHVLSASFSAGRWLAPFARQPLHVFYADEYGKGILRSQLQLKRADKGANVLVKHTEDAGIFADRIEAAPGIWCTGLVQTYLDLHVAGERGAEAAEHLRRHRIEPLWTAEE